MYARRSRSHPYWKDEIRHGCFSYDRPRRLPDSLQSDIGSTTPSTQFHICTGFRGWLRWISLKRAQHHWKGLFVEGSRIHIEWTVFLCLYKLNIVSIRHFGSPFVYFHFIIIATQKFLSWYEVSWLKHAIPPIVLRLWLTPSSAEIRKSQPTTTFCILAPASVASLLSNQLPNLH